MSDLVTQKRRKLPEWMTQERREDMSQNNEVVWGDNRVFTIPSTRNKIEKKGLIFLL